MAEVAREAIGPCPNPKCAKPVWSDHADPWCHNCGEHFPEVVAQQLPRLKASRALIREQPAVVTDQPAGTTMKQASIAA